MMNRPMTPAEMTATYIMLRDRKKAADDAHKASLEKLVAAMAKLEGLLLDHLNTTGANSLASDAGTVYRSTQLSATVDNRDAFLQYVQDNSLWDALDVKANKTFVRDFIDKNGSAMPGVKVSEMATVGVRRSK